MKTKNEFYRARRFYEVKIMLKIFRAASAIAAALCLALCIPAGFLWDMLAVWLLLGGTLFFFALSMLFKSLQEKNEKSAPPQNDAANAAETNPDAANDAEEEHNADGDSGNDRK